ncbi:MAG TPA: 23S rRNA (uracil(1939)-C(5))-methyltransferase RlmD [Bacteroidia bacterium]|nr:23S rRNA (uracil(1939)-C(5))-methyltransferase RlmD [Bacteroidia bacterium]HNU33582.1 23S rRNA (uracil(1939)-C(5))-methyltransferase RlmD [Bacteroidia bacterium]
MEKIYTDILITDITEDGRGVARIDGQVMFVKDTVPGDMVAAKVYKKKRRFLEAELNVLLKPSLERISPLCAHFGNCGGCKWQHLKYENQLVFKEKQVKDAFERLAGISSPAISRILGSEEFFEYRNKLEFTFSNREWLTQDQLADKSYLAKPALGFHVPGQFDKVLNIEQCHLQHLLHNKIRNKLKETALKNNIPFFNIKAQEGFLRNVIFRSSISNEWMVILIVYENKSELVELLLSDLVKNFPELKSVYYIVNEKKNDNYSDLKPILFFGNSFIEEEFDGLKFRIGPKTFFQTNTKQAHKLYSVTREFAGLSGKEIVFDLYTGTGTIALYVARNANFVIGIEYVPESIEAAKENAAINKIANTAFYAGDMKDVFGKDIFEKHGKPDVIITDPPRSGMHEDVVRNILLSDAKRIVYVSCNPPTQARDLKMMSDKYTFIKAQPVDMFPHTSHVENVALLELIN